MKHGHMFGFFGFVLAVSVGCTSTSPDTFSASSSNSTTNRSSVPYFTGTGGKGMSLGILVPESDGLDDNQAYLPRMVQGTLVSNISRYSAISVLDRVALDRVITETLDLTYEDNLDIVRLGHVAQVGYMMTGNITRTSTGYALQLNVSETAPSAATIAAYSGACTAAQFDDFSAIHRASKELLAQMNIQLTDAAVNELDRPSSSQNISAQRDLARGIVAQQKGTTVEAMAYYYNAVSFDPGLSEANGRLSTLSSSVSSGNIGENVRNDIQRRNEWRKLLVEAEEFFSKHLPFELVYSSSLTQGNIDYAKETVDLKSTISLMPSESFKAFDNILQGLESTGKRREWDWGLWPIVTDEWLRGHRGELIFVFGGNTPLTSKKIFPWVLENSYHRYTAEERLDVGIVLINENGKDISRTNVLLGSRIEFAQTRKRVDDNFGIDPNYAFNDIRSGRAYAYDMTKLEASENQGEIRFSGVNANDITDSLTIKIVSVNGVDVARNPEYIRITAR